MNGVKILSICSIGVLPEYYKVFTQGIVGDVL